MVCFTKKLRFILVLLVLYSIIFACNSKQKENDPMYSDDEKKEVLIPELTERSGLPNFFNKIEKGENINIAFFGGSITEMKGWRPKIYDWFNDTYPTTHFTQIMASAQGTGSEFGVYRADEHLLKGKPDLVFVEFSTNDHGREYKDVEASVEGIIRKIWKRNPETDICFLHTITNESYRYYESGRYPPAAKAIEDLAEYYMIPSINLATCIINAIDAGEIVLDNSTSQKNEDKIFAKDGIHPTNAGHNLYKEAIVRSMKKLSENNVRKSHKLLSAKSKNNLEDAIMIPVNSSQIIKKGQWNELNSDQFNINIESTVLNTKDEDASLEFTFEGTAFGVADYVGPKVGNVKITIDDSIYNIDRFDDFCHYTRMNYLIIDGLAHREHQVTVQISPTKPNKRDILKNGYFKFTDEQLNKMHGLEDYELLIIGFLYS